MKKKITIDPKSAAVQQFISEYCKLKLKASWSGKELYNGFLAFIMKNPVHAFNFTNFQTGNISCKSYLKKVCDQIFPYKNFKTKHYYIKTQEHLDFIQAQLKVKLTIQD